MRYNFLLSILLSAIIGFGQNNNKDRVAIGAAIDAWHLAAAKADSATYFDLMTEDAVFVGTDTFEVWAKKAFLAFSAPYFAKGKAWAFNSTSRNIYLSKKNAKIAWFDELLDTWMGPSRGSGVMVNQKGKWLIQHYVLSVTIPNDKINAVLDIHGKPKRK